MERDVAALDVRLLLAFDALMIELNVTRAAYRLGLTQQGMSGQLARMRQVFGDPLFVREGAGVAATPHAQALHSQVQHALTSLRALVARPHFDPATCDEVISVAATDYAIVIVLLPLLAKLRRIAPKLKLALRPLNAQTLLAESRTRVVDLALAVPEFTPPGLKSAPILEETYVGAVRQDHPLARENVGIEQFCAYSHLLVSPNRGDFHGATDDALAEVGYKREIALVVPGFSVVGTVLESTDLVAVLPRRLVAQSRRKLHVFEPPIPVRGFALHAYWPERLDADPAHIWFRQMVFETAI